MYSTVLRAAVLGLGLAVVSSPAAFAQGDPAAGKKVFRKCQACHVVQAGKNRVGPSLHNIVGQAPGQVEGYKYSKAMIEYGKSNVWDAATLDAYLENPRKAVKGTKMAFAGLKKQKDRDDVIAYIIEASK
jgi:cytochrome c